MTLTVASALGLVGAWAWISQPADLGPITYVDEPAGAREFVNVVRTGISTSENYIGHRIRVVEGSLVNASDRTLRSVRLRLSFLAEDGAVVMESDAEALTAPMEPGSERRFESRFENLPPEWDYRVPEVSVIQVGF